MDIVELKGFKGLALSLENDGAELAEIQHIPIEQIIQSELQPRRVFDSNEINNLASSIKAKGVLQPLIVRRSGNSFEIVAGERRWRASKVAGLKKLPVIIKNLDDKDVSLIALIENIQRENLNPIEEAKAYKGLVDNYSLTHEMVAEIVGKARVTISNMIRLLSLSDPVQLLVDNKKLEMGHARAVLSLEPEQQLHVADEVVAKKLSVRQTEQLVIRVSGRKKSVAVIRDMNWDESVNSYKSRIENKYGMNANIKLNKNGKIELVVKLNSLNDIEKFL